MAAMSTPPNRVQPPNTLGRIAVAVGVVGSVLACIPASLDIGWVLLAAGFVLGVVAVLQSGKSRKAAVAAIVIALLGALVSAGIVVFGVSRFLFDLFANLLDYIANNGQSQR